MLALLSRSTAFWVVSPSLLPPCCVAPLPALPLLVPGAAAWSSPSFPPPRRGRSLTLVLFFGHPTTPSQLQRELEEAEAASSCLPCVSCLSTALHQSGGPALAPMLRCLHRVPAPLCAFAVSVLDAPEGLEEECRGSPWVPSRAARSSSGYAPTVCTRSLYICMINLGRKPVQTNKFKSVHTRAS